MASSDGQAKRTALAWIDANRGRLSAFQAEIWGYAEPAFREYRSARAYCDLLRREGFDVTEGSGRMPTAFAAQFGSGGPVIGSYAEYDAVPENSQQAVPYQAPREGLHPSAAGHTDPHSALGVAGLAGVLAAKAAMQAHGLTGTLRFFGEPAEKVCGSKPVHAAQGYYDGADAYVAFHPHAQNSVAWETHCGAYWSAMFALTCPEPERWFDSTLLPTGAHAHTTARAPGALDAACLLYTTVKYLKEAMFPRTGTWTLNEFMMIGGQCTSDNLPPRFAAIQYAWRSPSLAIQERIADILHRTAVQTADATGCRADVRWITKTRVGLPNLALAELVYRNLEMVGPPVWDEAARDFGRAIQRTLGLDPMAQPFTESSQRLTTPQEYEAALRAGLPAWQTHSTSDDYVEYTWHAPTARLFVGRPRLRAPRPGYEYPAWTANALGGMPACIDPMTVTAGKTIAGSLVDLLTQPDALSRARREFEERTGGGVGGSQWVAPLLPREFAPPVDLRWPEYVTTPRGEEWWIPTPSA